MSRPSSKDLILDAAESVVRESGAVHMTLDAVAERAGVSKGGLLYNFPTKESLLEAMIARQVGRCEANRAEAEAKAGGDVSVKLRAYVESAFQVEGGMRETCAPLLAAGANNPKLLDPVREHYRKIIKELQNSDIDFDDAMVVMLASDGLWLLEMLQIFPLDEAQRARFHAKLLALSDQTVEIRHHK